MRQPTNQERAEFLIADGVRRGMPAAVIRIAIQQFGKKHDVRIPSDVFAYASAGRMSDRDVRDWNAPLLSS